MDFHTFLDTYFVLFLTIHILSVCMGLGGATIADTLFFRFLKDFRISKKEADVMQWLSTIVLTAIIFIYLSGGILFLSDMEGYMSSPAFVFKMTVVFVLTINGILLHNFVSPQLVHISFRGIHPHVPPSIHRLRKIAFGMGAVSATSWYTVFFTAMLKSIIPAGMGYRQMMLMYITALVIAVFSSQIFESHFHKHSESH